MVCFAAALDSAVDLPFPPVMEQEEIATSLKEAIENIDNTMDRARRQTELMEEYRTRLVADVVTGKIDVRTHYSSAIAQVCGTEWKT